MTVPDTTRPDGEVGINDLPGGKFALYRLEGDFEDIQKIIKQGFKDVFQIWLPQSGFQPDDKPCYELYYDAGDKGKFSADLGIPVKPL
jgi:AraC family transcriptional regulator